LFDGLQDVLECFRFTRFTFIWCSRGGSWGRGGWFRVLLGVFLSLAVNVPPEVAAVGQRVEIESLRACEGVGHHPIAGHIQAPKVLFATLGVREESFILALVSYIKYNQYNMTYIGMNVDDVRTCWKSVVL
jgi:hypothetical protein